MINLALEDDRRNADTATEKVVLTKSEKCLHGSSGMCSDCIRTVIPIKQDARVVKTENWYHRFPIPMTIRFGGDEPEAIETLIYMGNWWISEDVRKTALLAACPHMSTTSFGKSAPRHWWGKHSGHDPEAVSYTHLTLPTKA